MKVLICKWGCVGEYSATRGDYFWQPEGEPLKCHLCGSEMVIADKELSADNPDNFKQGVVENMVA